MHVLCSVLLLAPICVYVAAFGQHPLKITNPILPGFHPDPSCLRVPSGRFEDTFLCASSSFNVFPGIPIHASRDLLRWRLIGNVLSRPSQLPRLTQSTGGTSGIWAPTLRYHEPSETFYLFTTQVYDRMPKANSSRFENIFFTTKDPFSEWSDPTHFKFVGYDVSPWWDIEGKLEEGKIYVQGAHTWEIGRHVDQIILDLETGEATPQVQLWEGTGGIAPEGPHIFHRNGWYYLLIAEGGTGIGHMVTMARSRDLTGPFEPCPYNPVLTNVGTDSIFQAIGHADLLTDSQGNWWAVSLAVRGGPDFIYYPMGRETVLTNVSWPEGQDWPIFQPITKDISGTPLTRKPPPGKGPLVDANDHIRSFRPGFVFPPHWIHWRIPTASSYLLSPRQNPRTLQLIPSKLNLTGYDGQGVLSEDGSTWLDQTFVGRRQTHTFFTFTVTFEVSREGEGETGITVFLTQNHHIDFSVIATGAERYLRVRSITYFDRPEYTLPLPSSIGAGLDKITLQVRGMNTTHYEFLYADPRAKFLPLSPEPKDMKVIGYASTEDISWGFDGALLGVFATTNGKNLDGDTMKVFVKSWEYIGLGQVVE